MDVREKLAEVLNGIIDGGFKWHSYSYESGEQLNNDEIASHLIAHGVTVQELDGCEYCKEDSEGYRKMIGAFSITNPFHGNVWNIETYHCKPRQIYFCPMCGRKLPQPPKGE